MSKRSSSLSLLLAAILVAVGAGTADAIATGPATHAGAADVGTLQLSGIFNNKFSPVACPAGTPATTACHGNKSVRVSLSAGLGEVTMGSYTLVFDVFGSDCMHVHAQHLPVLVAGKGEIDLVTRSVGCLTPEQIQRFSTEFTVSGGSGRYAGASGSGMLTYTTVITGPEEGYAAVTWTGTLNVDGLAFDTTPPQVAGATSKVVRTRAAAGARVRYAVTATDAIDGLVPAACLPRSGSLFRIGRTTVTCTPVDGSGNTATAHFVITVKRLRAS